MTWMISDDKTHTYACNCIGPQRGEPLCPCKMRGVIVRDGRYILPEQDLDPVRDKDSDEDYFRNKLNILNG